MSEDWKDKLAALKGDSSEENSTEENIEYLIDHEKLICGLEKKGRGGKSVTTIMGFTTYYNKEINELAKELKRHFGVGGSVDDKKIVLQGDLRDKIVQYLSDQGYTVVKSGG